MGRENDLIRRLADGLGELCERHPRREDGPDLTAYADDPVGFIREVLGDEPWEKQREIARAVRDHDRVTVRSCNGSGKDWISARVALWWTYCLEGLVVLTAPTERQLQEIVMRKELAEAFDDTPELAGDRHVDALRPAGRSGAGVIAKTATDVSGLLGLHESRVLVVLSEAQDPELEPALEAAFRNALGEEDTVLALGNPTKPEGLFADTHREDSEWRAIKIAASDVPNVREGETVIPGLMTKAGAERLRSEYGRDSAVYTACVEGEFPAQAEDALIRRDWLEAATDRWREQEPARKATAVLAVDPARKGPDETVAALRQGDYLEIEAWDVEDTMEIVERICRRLKSGDGDKAEAATRRRAQPRTTASRRTIRLRPGSYIIVDAHGIGAGVFDRLREKGLNVLSFKGGSDPSQPHADRYVNQRTGAFWMLRRKLEDGDLALPPDDELLRELRAIRWRSTSKGQRELEPKPDLRRRLRRSPDRADAVAMAAWGWRRADRLRTERLRRGTYSVRFGSVVSP